ncbi:Z1 domain-containing protein [Bifidobacterium criceti]|uniref:Endonuclease n=1 Tax=Bifidobacterium criceti TaxID=1960969 RepID=A0A2A2EGG4_9BIFI|nr:Z1 domain-containing protein [Bifidobacterium criceti]PAU68279.1 endonuclease [Bifidobacterium criceti]
MGDSGYVQRIKELERFLTLFLTPSQDDGATIDDMQIFSTIPVLAERKGIKLTDDQVRQVFRNVRQALNLQIDTGSITIRNENAQWHPWLSEMSELPTPHTDAYYQYLFNDQDAMYTQLDKDTNNIMNLLSDPRESSAPISRKGLLLGDVQSGKTRTYMALMNKAVDRGYKLVIVLTSDNEKLRKQTQDRIDTDCIGLKRGKYVGVGEYLPKGEHLQCLTNMEDDFATRSKQAFDNMPRPNWRSRPLLAVMKKNGSVLKKFIEWLDNDDFTKDIPILIIDDESDYASVNSSKIGADPTAINALLRRLCSISTRTSYAAVTATPFANIFIDDEEAEDLFPEDFIYILPTPAEYIGVLKIFGNRNEEDAAENDQPEGLPAESPVRLLDQDSLGHWLPLIHKKTFSFEEQRPNTSTELQTTEDSVDDLLDAQVRHAINCFLIACILRPDGIHKRQSMLIHMSRFQDVQQQIADRVYLYIESLNNALRFHANSSANLDPRIQSLHASFDEEYAAYASQHGKSWEDVLHDLKRLIRDNRVVVRLENSTSDDWNHLHGAGNEDDQEEDSNECTIYVGGNQLSRGMTLRGLICSIFYRQVTAADTLLQMGRWFGYRPNYEELQRVWLLPQTVADFKYSGSIIEDIKATARDIQKRHGTPKQFGIAVRKNPSTGVRITNPAKMRHAEEGQGIDFDLENLIIESVKLSTKTEISQTNNEAFSQLLQTILSDDAVAHSTDPKGNTVVFEGVPANAIASFLQRYRAGYGDTYFGKTLLHYRNMDPRELETTMAQQFAQTQHDERPDLTWNVAFMNGRLGAIDVPFHWTTIQRAYKEDPSAHIYQVSGNKLRLGSKTDVVKVAQAITGKPITREIRNERDFYDTKLFGDHPTLMLYRVALINSATNEVASIPDSDGLLAAKIVVPSDTPGSPTGRGKATFYLNTVAARQFYEQQLQQEEFEGED